MRDTIGKTNAGQLSRAEGSFPIPGFPGFFEHALVDLD